MNPVRSLLGVLLFGIVLGGTGCGLFETRTPEEPEQTSSNYQAPTDASIVFENMKSAFQDLNTVNYVKSFADSTTTSLDFSFEPSPAGRSRFAALFQVWDRSMEQQYFENLKSRLPAGSVPSLVLSIDRETISVDSTLVEATYQLTVPHQQTSFPQTARGRAQFTLRLDQGGYWYITRWIDLANAQNDFTWSEMKGEFAQ